MVYYDGLFSAINVWMGEKKMVVNKWNSWQKIKITMNSNLKEQWNVKQEKINKEREFSELGFFRKQFLWWIDVEIYFSSS